MLGIFYKPWPTPEKIAKIVCRQADAGTIMGIIRPSNPIVIGLRRLSLEFLRETHEKI